MNQLIERAISLTTGAAASGGGTAFVQSQPIRRPLRLRGILLQTNSPEFRVIAHVGWSTAEVSGDTDRQSGTAYFSTEGNNNIAGRPDGQVMLTGQVYLGPMNVRIDDPMMRLWIGLFNNQAAASAVLAGTFFFQYDPDESTMEDAPAPNQSPNSNPHPLVRPPFVVGPLGP